MRNEAMMKKVMELKKVSEKKAGIDWDEVTFKAPMGDTRVRIIPNVNSEELFFLGDGYHVLTPNYYADCDGANCPICSTLKKLWSDDDITRKSVYRTIKRKARFTYQVVLLNDDGSVATRTPKLFLAPKTLHDIILEKAFNDLDVTEMDLIIRKEQGSPYVKYDNSYFVDGLSIEYNEDEIKPLDLGRNYSNEKTNAPLDKIKEQFNL